MGYNIKIPKCELPTIVVFILFAIMYNYFVVFYGMGNSISNWRYYIFAIVSILSLLIFLLKYKTRKQFIEGKSIIYIIITSLAFFIVSFVKCQQIGVKMPFRVYVQISLFLLPCLYAFNLKNILSIKSIFIIMKALTILTIIFYFLEPRHFILKFFDINNYLNISFIHSKSFTESHNFFDSFLQLFLFFNYFELKVNDLFLKRSLNKYKKITFIFTIMSFKRFGVLFAFVVLLFRKKIKYNNNFKINILFITAFFTILTLLYTSILQGKIFNFTYQQLFDFTSGRNWFLSMWKSNGYISYGYGSSMLIIGKYLEMDLTQIYLELNLFCLILFIYSFLKLSENKTYPIIIICYVLFNMLTSSSLPWSMGWIIMFLNILCINSIRVKNELEKINSGGSYERFN